MKVIKSPAKRANDGHAYQRHSLTPMSKTLRNVAELVLHDRVTKPTTGKGSGYKTRSGRAGAKRRFTESDVLAIRRRHKAGERICNLAREFACAYEHMSHILDGSSYGWVRDDLDAA